MKKQLSVLIAAFLVTFSVATAQEVKAVPPTIVAALLQEFKDATTIDWKTTDNYYKASFTTDGKPLEAFFSFEGKVIAVSRHILPEQLPLSLIKEARERAATSPVSELFELLTDRGTEYFITYKTEKELKTFKSNGSGWTRL